MDDKILKPLIYIGIMVASTGIVYLVVPNLFFAFFAALIILVIVK